MKIIRKIKKLTGAVLILGIFAAPSIADDKTVQQVAVGLAVLNALFGGASNNQQNRQQNDPQLIKLKSTLLEHSEKFADDFCTAASKYGGSEALKKIRKLFMQKGISAEISESSTNPDNETLTAYDNKETIEFEVDNTHETVTVTASVPEVGVYEKTTKEFSTAPKMTITVQETEFNMLDSAGFDVADKSRSPDGYLILSKIQSGSAMSNLGALEGSDLYTVDALNTKTCSAQELREYIKQRAKEGAKITVSFMADDGSRKNIDVRLK